MPLRLTVSPRTLAKNGVELKLRKEKDFSLVAAEAVLEEVKAALARARIRVAPMPASPP
jgi:hypothetical protein